MHYQGLLSTQSNLQRSYQIDHKMSVQFHLHYTILELLSLHSQKYEPKLLGLYQLNQIENDRFLSIHLLVAVFQTIATKHPLNIIKKFC